MLAFSRIALLVIVLALGVILAGGVVRTTGSGMGCPDWPKCFGQYIPPTDISQLPPNYKEIFKVQGKEIADFDAFKTWVEYINRLLGALLGVVIVILTFLSLRLERNRIKFFCLSLALLFVTGFVGWLGSVVVATDLAPVKITLHMLSSTVILAISVSIYFLASNEDVSSAEKALSTQKAKIQKTPQKILQLRYLLIAAIILTLLQIILGTQVREQIDIIAKSLEGRWREHWIEQLNFSFIIHRSMSWLILVVNGVLVWQMVTQQKAQTEFQANFFESSVGKSIGAICSLLVLEIAFGVIMNYFAIPKVVQPLHLLFAMALFAVQFHLFLNIWKGKLS